MLQTLEPQKQPSQQPHRVNARGERYVIGPMGAPLTLNDLPPANTERWVIRRKAEVVAAVRGGLLTFADACKRYRLTDEEFEGWQASIDRHGMPGLRTTRLQHYR
ncbi:MAG: CtrA inhibitor SciP [Caulobacteraceae bacterium]